MSAAASGVPGGPLAAALAAFATELGERAGEMAGAVGGAGATLTSNAATYTGGDAGAARRLDEAVQP